jgi:hypothetical protein
MTNAATGLLPERTVGCGASLLFLVTLSGNASAQAGDAERILRAMSDYLTSQDTSVRHAVETVPAVGAVETKP